MAETLSLDDLDKLKPIQSADASASAPPSTLSLDDLDRLPVKAEDATQHLENWSDVPGAMVAHALPSAARMAESIATPFLHPLHTAKGVMALGTGIQSKAGVPVVEGTPAAHFMGRGAPPATRRVVPPAEAQAPVNAVGKFYGDRYGSLDKIRDTLGNDPFGVAMDASTVLGGVGGGLTRAGVTGAGSTLTRAGELINPVTGAIEGARALGQPVASTIGMMSGAGELPITEAARAGARPGGSQAFLDAIAQRGNPTDVVDQAMDAVRNVQREGSVDYLGQTANMRANRAPLDTRSLDPLRVRLWNTLAPNGFVKSQAAAGTFRDINSTINRFRANGLTHPGAVDDLKQALGEIVKGLNTPGATPLQRSLAGDAYHHVRDLVARSDPGYDAAMRNYSEVKDTLDELQRTLSLNDRATADTSLRKLQSIMRNNANTNYGARERLIRDHIVPRAPDLMPTLAGHSLNTWSSRGIARATSGPVIEGLAAGALTHAINPWSMLTLPLLSPKAMGYGAYGAGRAGGVVGRALERAGINLPRAREAARGAFYAGNAVNAEDPEGAY
jgi:hypothetical protein